MFTKKDLKRLIIPLIIEQILAMTIGMVDTMMVSSVGEAAVSGISLVDTVNILLINIFAALATGGAVVASQYIGRKDHESANKAAKQLVIVTAMLAIVLMGICLAVKEPLLALIFKIDGEVMSNAQIYFTISAISYPFIALYNSGAALFRAMGNSKISMYNSIIMNILNVCGNALLIYVFHMGVLGAALATLFSRIVGSISMLWMLRNESLMISVRGYFKTKLDFGMIKNILHIGIPNGLENGMFQIGKILVAGVVASFGTASIAANAVANNIAGIEIIPGAAMGLAIVTVVGQCVGAGDYKEAEKYAKYLMKITLLTMLGLNVLVALLGKPILSLYSLSSETMSIAYNLLLLHSVFAILIWSFAFTLPNVFRAANDAKYTMSVSIFSMWVFRICACFFLAYTLKLGVYGVWWAMILDWCFRSICFIWRFKTGKWKHKQLI